MSDITELYNRNPLSLTDDDITALVADQRQRRSQFQMGNIKAGNVKAKPKTPAQKKIAGLALDLTSNL